MIQWFLNHLHHPQFLLKVKMLVLEILSNSEMEKISLRFSFSKFNSLEEVDYVVTFLKDFINDN